jgi:hypothetical protein
MTAGEKTMGYENAIAELEAEWSPDDGFFWRIRQGNFSPSDFERALKKISAINIGEDADVPRRVVSLLWYIPLFMQWQVERVQENKGDLKAYATAITKMTNEIERLLGVP